MARKIKTDLSNDTINNILSQNERLTDAFSNRLPDIKANILPSSPNMSLDQPMFKGSNKKVRDVLTSAPVEQFGDSYPTYSGKTTSFRPGVTGPFTGPMTTPIRKEIRSSKSPMSPTMAESVAKSSHEGRTSHFHSALRMGELAGLHEHAGNNKKIIENLVNL